MEVKLRSRLVNIIIIVIMVVHITIVYLIYDSIAGKPRVMYMVITIEYFLFSLGYACAVIYLHKTCNKLS